MLSRELRLLMADLRSQVKGDATGDVEAFLARYVRRQTKARTAAETERRLRKYVLPQWGERRILKAGEFFGEVALTMHVPRTATVTAMTPCVVASCDEETFDELGRPLFADDP